MLLRMNGSHYELTGLALEILKLSPGDRVLDIGCGGGSALKRMAEKITDGFLCGVDYSSVSVDLSSELNKESIERGKMKIYNASVENLPFENERFDKILTVESFYFWPEPAENLREVFRILKKGGIFTLAADIYNRDGLCENDLKMIKEYNLFNPTVSEFLNMFENVGFDEISVHIKKGSNRICVAGKK